MNPTKQRVAIVGSTGYGGVELIRFLQHHPHVEITSVISASSSGSPMSDQFPHLGGVIDMDLDGVDALATAAKADIVFTATPSGVSSTLVPQYLEAGLKVIDLSGDFRLKDSSTYEQWYKHDAPADHYLAEAVYGLCEQKGNDVQDQRLISNPGCYPTATLLGLMPGVEAGWIDHSSIIIDAKSGVSGAGRGTSLTSHYAEMNENFKAYKLNKHQHIPEIEQVLSGVTGEPVVVTFSTQLVPMTRGIMTTMYATIKGQHNEQDWIDLYREYYCDRPFVRIRKQGNWPSTKEVAGSNYCDIGFAVDERTGRITIVSVIDNLVKGAAGQAIQNLNRMMGWEETLGLKMVPVYP
ncbi:N-acetyl-gamma-glutamyl-phosphate reductase [Paenibacillus sp. PK4536]|uniref:N-acetyl-gamma-glutamyl-phosphate reductase n=1 Tax=Paenibacillus sp. PK4536 TaxID=3024576 RepID=UPI002359F888|nr:N-acetyl-gamma-glutamyl-phosphate reductase [Paenibacillus sp. PK4536]WIM39797.1 N-acetyl-gamma-glutamyl-phosphate reductase [Paenibacillus sp. PK4536]